MDFSTSQQKMSVNERRRMEHRTAEALKLEGASGDPQLCPPAQSSIT